MGKVFKALSKAAPSEVNLQSQSQPPQAAPENGHSPFVGAQVKMSSSESLAESQKIGPSEAATVKSIGHNNLTDKEGNLGDWDERLVAITDSGSIIAESFRRLRTKILHPDDNKPLRTILFTSATPGEGKSFTCANLAITLAQSVEKHALIVDCDLRRSAVAPLFGLGNDRGVVNHLKDNVDLVGLIQKTGMRKLSIIASGPPPVNPAELLDSKRMMAMIDELTSRYSDRIILLDTPPMQAASETTVLAKHVDGVVVVVKWGGAGRQQVKDLVEAIGKEKILGIVFNAYEQTMLEKTIGGYGYEAYYSTKT